MDEQKLQKYLMKCELQYRADHMEHAASLGWLAPHCGSVEDIQQFLKELGFRIGEVVDEEDCDGVPFKWVTTVSGIIVYVNSESSRGLFKKISR